MTCNSKASSGGRVNDMYVLYVLVGTFAGLVLLLFIFAFWALCVRTPAGYEKVEGVSV